MPIVYAWNRAPFLRLLPPLMAGIALQYHLGISWRPMVFAIPITLLLLLLHALSPLRFRRPLQATAGIGWNALLLLMGALLVEWHDIRQSPQWIGHAAADSSYIWVMLEEPPVAKANSWKAVASVKGYAGKSGWRAHEGKLILYFKKEKALPPLDYGDEILFKAPLQIISGARNPGGFDYQTYCLFQGITHQAYLKASDYNVLPRKSGNPLPTLVFHCRNWIVAALKAAIPPGKEQGLAEALLIGYKDDLDKSLVQAYSNTGVVHVIAISGLHLGLIYSLLLWLTKPLAKKSKLAFLRLLIVLSALWLFSLMAGAQPSVLRSAVMFSCLALSEVLVRRTFIWNTLALSAFVLLCINPFWLWDAGFQLSYAAVASIIAFFRPIYRWFHFTHPLLDAVWKLNAVTIAAQLLTLPVSIYHFHQLPLLFLFTNIVAVPLSSLILMVEILLCACIFFLPLAKLLGIVVQGMVWMMNAYVERFDRTGIAVWEGLSIGWLQALLLTGCIIAVCCWLLNRAKPFIVTALFLLSVFLLLRSFDLVRAERQRRLIVYEVPGHTAVDLVNGRNCFFIGDRLVQQDPSLYNFNLRPARIAGRIRHSAVLQGKSILWQGLKILLLDTAFRFSSLRKDTLDLLVLARNPKLYMREVQGSFFIRQVVIDASVPPWKARLWKKDCDALHIPCFDVRQRGAFVMNF